MTAKGRESTEVRGTVKVLISTCTCGMYMWPILILPFFWIKELDLTEEDFYCFQNGLHLSEILINASQRLMKQHFKVHGLQNTLCGQNLTF